MYGKANEIFSVAGKRAFITGGTRGLGRAMGTCLLENGCDVFAVSRNACKTEEMEAAAACGGSRYRFFPCDVTNTQEVVAAVAEAERVMGGIDILINAAGICILKMMDDMDDESFMQVIRINLTSTFVVTREVARVMKRQHYGKVLSISSMKSIFGTSSAGYTAYCSSKGAVNMLTKQMACELAAHNITVNAIAPTFIHTDINDRQLADKAFYQSLVDRIPMGRIGEFPDLMGLLLLLCSDASSFLTGQTFLLDGGIAARQ